MKCRIFYIKNSTFRTIFWLESCRFLNIKIPFLPKNSQVIPWPLILDPLSINIIYAPPSFLPPKLVTQTQFLLMLSFFSHPPPPPSTAIRNFCLPAYTRIIHRSIPFTRPGFVSRFKKKSKFQTLNFFLLPPPNQSKVKVIRDRVWRARMVWWGIRDQLTHFRSGAIHSQLL